MLSVDVGTAPPDQFVPTLQLSVVPSHTCVKPAGADVASKSTVSVPNDARTMCTAPIPSVYVTAASPLALVITVSSETVPPPLTTLNTMGWPTTGVALLVRRATNGCASGCPSWPIWLSPLSATKAIVAGAVAVAVKEALRAPLVALSVCAPGVSPSVQVGTAAAPVEFVNCSALPPIEPPPDVTANVTATPATGFAYWSRSRTAGDTGSAVPATAVWPLPSRISIDVAAPASTLCENPTVNPSAAASTARRPARVSAVTLTLARPLASVVSARAESVPRPVCTLHRTITPGTGVVPSSARTTIGAPNAVVTAALCALPETGSSDCIVGSRSMVVEPDTPPGVVAVIVT